MGRYGDAPGTARGGSGGDPSSASRRLQSARTEVRGVTASGPTLICVAAVHGNEPAAVIALQRVFDALDKLRPPCRGRFVGLTGNLAALSQGRRFVVSDLNRQWTPRHIDAIRRSSPDEWSVENREQIELSKALDQEFAATASSVYFIDMHTTSAHGAPFVVLSDTLRNRAFALSFPVPIVLGLEERVGGTLPGYVSDLGHITMGFEAGQHDDPASVDIHEAAVWRALFATGMIDAAKVPEADAMRDRLIQAARGAPKLLDIRHRHHVRDEDGFVMEPGYVNFQAVSKGDILARDRSGPIRASRDCHVLLPLYQTQGGDGFFLSRPVRPAWLALSAWLRRLRLGALAHWLPGVRKDPSRINTLLVNPMVARWLVTEFFHLLGFRQRGREDGRLVFTRRE